MSFSDPCYSEKALSLPLVAPNLMTEEEDENGPATCRSKAVKRANLLDLKNKSI